MTLSRSTFGNPKVVDVRFCQDRIGVLAVAREAITSRLAPATDSLEADLDAAMCWPAYVPYLPA